MKTILKQFFLFVLNILSLKKKKIFKFKTMNNDKKDANET